MKPNEDFSNGGDDAAAADESGSDREEEERSVWAEDLSAPARSLAALNALRKARQHFDVTLCAGGSEIPAHRAVLAASSPYLLDALSPNGTAYRIRGVTAVALASAVDYAYTGKLIARDPTSARDLYKATWHLRLENARTQLAEAIVRRAVGKSEHADCIAARELPDLPANLREQLNKYFVDNFESIISSGALAAIPTLQLDVLVREDAAAPPQGDEECPQALAEAALQWTKAQLENDGNLDELSSREHLLFVDPSGSLQDCVALPPSAGDAPELTNYRKNAAHRRPPNRTNSTPVNLPTLELGSRTIGSPDWAVLSAIKGRNTRALLALNGRVAVARITKRVGVQNGGTIQNGEVCGRLARGRCAHGAAALDGRLIVVGGYDRTEALKDAESYDPATNEWSAAADMRGARARCAAARLGSEVFALGGSDGHAELDSVVSYSGKQWSVRAKLPGARSHAAAAAVEPLGALYCVGGWYAGVSLRAVLKYTPHTDTWTEAPSLNVGRSQCAAVWWEGALWALGGCSGWHCLASVETLKLGDPDAKWELGPQLPTPRRSVGGCEWQGRLVSTGGSDGTQSLKRTDWLVKGESEWKPGPCLNKPRANLSLSVLGRSLYAVGGFSGREFLSCVETLADPADQWTLLRDSHKANIDSPLLAAIPPIPEDIIKITQPLIQPSPDKIVFPEVAIDKSVENQNGDHQKPVENGKH